MHVVQLKQKMPMSDDPLKPDLLHDTDGQTIETAEAWQQRRQKLLSSLVQTQYGGMPDPPASQTFDLLHQHRSRRWQAEHETRRAICRGKAADVVFYIDLMTPYETVRRPAPVVIHGDGCWTNDDDAAIASVLGQGFALLRFNRVEVAGDLPAQGRTGPIYSAYPDDNFGAISAWAWAYHRAVDFIETDDRFDAGRAALIGHSRGGKTVLLAAATDQRVAGVAANNSGCGGAGSFRVVGEGAERIADLMRQFPYWFGPEFGQYAGREETLQFDQHVLLAAIAPRAVVTIEGEEDLWANPSGTAAVHRSADSVFKLLGTPNQRKLIVRPGGHGHFTEDWQAAMAFFADRL
jgi:pimeloyl-ACP methyl ester carboxylesterase